MRLSAIRQENQTKYQLDAVYGLVGYRDEASVVLVGPNR